MMARRGKSASLAKRRNQRAERRSDGAVFPVWHRGYLLAGPLSRSNLLLSDCVLAGGDLCGRAGSHLSLPRDQFSPRGDRRRQRGDAGRAEKSKLPTTKPIEDAVSSVPGLVTVRSTTSRGSAEVSLFFDWSVDMYRTLQLVDAAIGKARQALPNTAIITTNRLTFATFPILGYSLTSDRLSQTQLWELATYQLRPPLNRVAGVSTVTVQGGKVPEFHVVPNMARMQTAGVTILDLVNAVQASNIVDSPGLYEANHQLILGLVGAQAHDADQLGQLVIKTTSAGAAVRVADVATVQPGVLPVYTNVTSNRHPAVLLNIARHPSSNTV